MKEKKMTVAPAKKNSSLQMLAVLLAGVAVAIAVNHQSRAPTPVHADPLFLPLDQKLRR